MSSRFIALVALTLLAGCGMSVPPPVIARAGQEFRLAPGQTANLDGTEVSVEFVSVTEESRCPRDTTCIWQGNARITLDVSDPPAAPTRLELDTAGLGRRAKLRTAFIEVHDLIPQPPIIDPGSYAVTLFIEAAP